MIPRLVALVLALLASASAPAAIVLEKSRNVGRAANFWYHPLETSATRILAFDERQGVVVPAGFLAVQQLNRWDDIATLDRVDTGNTPVDSHMIYFDQGKPGPGRVTVTKHQLAHAELNALLAMIEPEPYLTIREWTLFTTMEPCPLCMGAIYMSGLRQVEYAARDPYAGAVDVLGKTPYYARKAMRVNGPYPLLEVVSGALNVAQMMEDSENRAEFLRGQWRGVMPEAVALGEQLFAEQALPQWRVAGHTAAEMYNAIAARVGQV